MYHIYMRTSSGQFLHGTWKKVIRLLLTFNRKIMLSSIQKRKTESAKRDKISNSSNQVDYFQFWADHLAWLGTQKVILFRNNIWFYDKVDWWSWATENMMNVQDLSKKGNKSPKNQLNFGQRDFLKRRSINKLPCSSSQNYRQTPLNRKYLYSVPLQ